ncbi:hypothetical protein IWQ47_003838 [Aquimarina sp. EL_43]|nr:hypothetical protein [Aquimarina sp. EL_35]MBG6152744.1 hypothetical protein [Aquimarina sp. EL_32]MBG6170751.1 hypothetical protein [Aquimarina sp. EL_43]
MHLGKTKTAYTYFYIQNTYIPFSGSKFRMLKINCISRFRNSGVYT